MRVKVNDREIEVPPGTSAMDAVFHANYDVPLFCTERYLSPTGSCRMCLVRIGTPRRGPDGGLIKEENGAVKIFYFPKLMASCTTEASEGMHIDTLSEEVKKVQSGMLEFTLINHPLDCPVCDKGGACELQDRSMEYGLDSPGYVGNEQDKPLYTRYTFGRRYEEKHHDLNAFITLDRERCIRCSRCVRYFEEIPGDEVLDFIERAVDTFVGTADYDLPSNFTGNITDICPVGALLDRVARFRGRNWEYDHTPTTSMVDAGGQQIWVDARSGHIERIRAREHPQTSQMWISDAARFGHEHTNIDRLRRPLVRREGRLVEVSWDEALAYMREGLKETDHTDVGLYLSGSATLEEGYAAASLAKSMSTPHLDFEGRGAMAASGFPALTYQELLAADQVLVFGDPTEELPTLHVWLQRYLRGLKTAAPLAHGTPFADLQVKEHMPRRGEKLTVFAPHYTALMKWAGRQAVFTPGRETELLGALATWLERPSAEITLEGLDAAPFREAAKRFLAARTRVMILGADVLADAEAAGIALKISQIYRARVFAMTPAANARGLEAMGVWPGERGATLEHSGPQVAFYGGVLPSEAVLSGQNFRVVHHTHMTSLMERYADVVLPASSAYEKRGATINAEGRVLTLNACGIDNGEAEGMIQSLAVFARALEITPPVQLLRQARKQIREHYRLDLDALPEEGLVWRPKGPWSVVIVKEEADARLYLRPTMWRSEMLRGTRVLAALGRNHLGVHPATAAEQALAEGQLIELETSLGLEQAQVHVDNRLPRGYLYLEARDGYVGRRLTYKLLVPAGGEA